MTRAGVRDEGRGAPAAACKRSFAGPRVPAKAAITGPERPREPRTERRERPHAGSAFGNGVMRSALNRNTVTLLYYERATRVDLDAIDRLCTLFNVSVGDLFEHVPGNASQAD
ncbi:helix-turn-helix transcriptional regulator [uncultured Tepidimonas sp.]|uniref:helix-turn-helix domain-containing protein n=1 Tax=uncultured Tepidimonas sp. TaxID=453579 RepID=UPI003449C359